MHTRTLFRKPTVLQVVLALEEDNNELTARIGFVRKAVLVVRFGSLVHHTRHTLHGVTY